MSILKIGEKLKKKVNLILGGHELIWGIFPFFLGGKKPLMVTVSILLRVTSTLWTTVPFNWGYDITF